MKEFTIKCNNCGSDKIGLNIIVYKSMPGDYEIEFFCTKCGKKESELC